MRARGGNPVPALIVLVLLAGSPAGSQGKLQCRYLFANNTTFSEKDLVKPEAVDNNDLRGAKKYFLKWGFKRLGPISRDNFVRKGKTPVITK